MTLVHFSYNTLNQFKIHRFKIITRELVFFSIFCFQQKQFSKISGSTANIVNIAVCIQKASCISVIQHTCMLETYLTSSLYHTFITNCNTVVLLY